MLLLAGMWWSCVFVLVQVISAAWERARAVTGSTAVSRVYIHRRCTLVCSKGFGGGCLGRVEATACFCQQYCVIVSV